VVETLARVGHLLLGQVHQPRIDTEAIQRRLQVAGQFAQLGEQRAFATVHEQVELVEKQALIAGGERASQGRNARTVLGAQRFYC
jgi:hypothetical protein